MPVDAGDLTDHLLTGSPVNLAAGAWNGEAWVVRGGVPSTRYRFAFTVAAVVSNVTTYPVVIDPQNYSGTPTPTVFATLPLAHAQAGRRTLVLVGSHTSTSDGRPSDVTFNTAAAPAATHMWVPGNTYGIGLYELANPTGAALDVVSLWKTAGGTGVDGYRQFAAAIEVINAAAGIVAQNSVPIAGLLATQIPAPVSIPPGGVAYSVALINGATIDITSITGATLDDQKYLVAADRDGHVMIGKTVNNTGSAISHQPTVNVSAAGSGLFLTFVIAKAP